MPHIALAQIFSRSARRAGFSLTMTQGFSPRAKLSFGPELPAGVVALNEPADLYFAEDYSDILEGLNSALPEGFRVSRVMFPPEDSPSLGKSCKHAEYFVRSVNGSELHDLAKNFYAEALRFCEVSDGWLRLILADPSQNPIGGWVRSLIGENIISGWHEINIVRAAIGIYDAEKGGVFMNA